MGSRVTEPVIDTSVADPESTYEPYDEDPEQELRKIPIEPGDADDTPLREALQGAPEGAFVEWPMLNRHAEKWRGRLTRRQMVLLRAWLAGRHNQSRGGTFADGIPPVLLEECRRVLFGPAKEQP